MEGINIDELIPYGSIKVYKRGQIVRHQDDPISEVLVLLEGLLKTEYISDNGKSLEVDLIKPVRIVASGLIFSKESRFPVNIISELDAKILEIDKERFLNLLINKKDLLKFFLEDVSEHFRTVSEKLFLLTTKKLREKVIYYLIKHANERNEVTLPTSIEELSKLLGCARPALSRIFQELIREGIIEKSGRKIKIKTKRADL